MIDINDLQKVLCRCRSCSDCDTSSFDIFGDLVLDWGDTTAEQERQKMIDGDKTLHRILFPFSAERIVASGDFSDRAQLMSLNRVDFSCKRVLAIIAEIPEDTMWFGFVLSRLKHPVIFPEDPPFVRRRRKKPTVRHYDSADLFRDHGIEVLSTADPDYKKKRRLQLLRFIEEKKKYL